MPCGMANKNFTLRIFKINKNQNVTQMNFSMKQKQIHRHRIDLWLPRGRGLEVGCIESVGLANANYYI